MPFYIHFEHFLAPHGVERYLWSSLRSNNADHKRIRAVVSRAFSERLLAAQEPLLLEHIALLIHKLRNHALGPTANPVDLVQWFNFITFDIVGDLGFGESFHCVENGVYHEWVGGVIAYLKMRTVSRVIGYFPSLKGLLLAMTPSYVKKKRTRMARWSADRVEKRIAMKTERPDFYTAILNKTGKNGLSNAELREIGLFLMFAGSETVSLIGSYLEEKDMSIASLSVNETLNAILDETLRLFPPIPSHLWRKVPKGGSEICGRFVPENVTVGLCPYAVQRREDYFPNADRFQPERWMDKQARSNNNVKAFNPFSLGSRNCIGQSLAYAEMRLIVAHFLWNFDLLPIEDHTWMDRCKSHTAWAKPPLMAKFDQRATTTPA
ncbi:MAG: hypothetical protein Q9182_006517 [Xanthomendoza sp. 2 TL-2023]